MSLAPSFVEDGLALQTTAAPINRIRLTAKTVPEGTVLQQETVTVDPNQGEWSLDFRITVPTGPDLTVVVTIELINEDAGVQTVQWSGTTAPFALRPGPAGSPQPVPVFRGPLSNLDVTAVTITTTAPTVEETSSLALAATVSGGSGQTQVFWTALDPGTVTVSESGVATGVLPGTGRVVATAGPRADTVTVTVTVKVQTIQVTPAAATLQSVGATQAFTAKALDPRGAEVPGVNIVFSVAPANVATHSGNGVMQAVANGVATVSAVGRGVTGTATLTVAQVPVSVVVTPGSASIATIGGTTLFTATVRDANNNVIPGAPVTWESAPLNIATVGATTGLVTGVGNGVATITARASATVFGTATVTVGALTFLTQTFEGVLNWTLNGMAVQTSGVGIVNSLHPTYVNLSGTGGPGFPAAPQGTQYLWFGSPGAPSAGSYLGQQEVEDSPNSGGTGTSPQMGEATSPTFTVPAGFATIYVSFRSWFEIEGVSPEFFDRMTVQLVDNATGAVVFEQILNQGLFGSFTSNLPTTSGGQNVPPVFEHLQFQATGVGGRTLRLRLVFETVDDQYNGFRGWIVDDVRVATTPPPGAGQGAAAAEIVPMESCAVTGCVRPTPPARGGGR